MNKTESAKKVAEDVLQLVNSYGVDAETFAETICNAHRTLQQSTMRLFIATIHEMAKNNTDARNEQAVELAKKIAEIAQDYPLPLI